MARIDESAVSAAKDAAMQEKVVNKGVKNLPLYDVPVEWLDAIKAMGFKQSSFIKMALEEKLRSMGKI